MLVSLFKNATSKEFQDVEINLLLDAIFKGKWANKIDIAHDLINTKGKKEYDEFKKTLPAITWAGTFKERNNKGLNNYSGLMVLDIDNIDFETIKTLKKQLKENNHVLVAFTSPSSQGIKIIVPVTSGPEHHLAAFLHLQKEFETKYCLKIDDSGKDISRLCFVSYDHDMYWNAQAIPFEVDIRYGEVKTYVLPEGLKNYKAQGNTDIIFKTCVGWVETGNNPIQYTEGSRNRFVHALACAMNRVGVEMEATKSYIKNSYDLDQKEIDATVRKAYFQNQGEHGSVEFKDMGLHEFTAPPYVQNYTDDVVVNDIMITTALLHHHGVPNDKSYEILSKIGRYYQAKNFIDFKRKSLGSIMNAAVQALNAKTAEITDKHKLEYIKAQDLGRDFVKIDISDRCIPTNIASVDASMRGGMMPGCVYAIIGVGGTYKSILAQFFSVAAASMGKACLWLNGEMSDLQFYERLCSMILQINLWQALSSKQVNEENIDVIISKINEILKDNLFFVGGSGFGKEAILATIKNIEATTGKKIGMVVIDGLSQMDSCGLQEIPAAIANSEIAKKIAKEADIVVIPLIHISGDQSSAKIRRDNGPFVRGGGKMTANMDGYFSTSLLVNEVETKALDGNGELIFIENKFHLKYVDKRAGTGQVSTIINVDKYLEITEDENDPRTYEVKL